MNPQQLSGDDSPMIISQSKGSVGERLRLAYKSAKEAATLRPQTDVFAKSRWKAVVDSEKSSGGIRVDLRLAGLKSMATGRGIVGSSSRVSELLESEWICAWRVSRLGRSVSSEVNLK
ncbi:hypothetical protein QQ045_007557 [Rhodiola kirilowii]